MLNPAMIAQIAEFGVKTVAGLGIGVVVDTATKELIKQAGLAGAEKFLAKAGGVAISFLIGHGIDMALNPAFEQLNKMLEIDEWQAIEEKIQEDLEEQKEEEEKEI